MSQPDKSTTVPGSCQGCERLNCSQGFCVSVRWGGDECDGSERLAGYGGKRGGGGALTRMRRRVRG
jgi:hypothetical protein